MEYGQNQTEGDARIFPTPGVGNNPIENNPYPDNLDLNDEAWKNNAQNIGNTAVFSADLPSSDSEARFTDVTSLNQVSLNNSTEASMSDNFRNSPENNLSNGELQATDNEQINNISGSSRATLGVIQDGNNPITDQISTHPSNIKEAISEVGQLGKTISPSQFYESIRGDNGGEQ